MLPEWFTESYNIWKNQRQKRYATIFGGKSQPFIFEISYEDKNPAIKSLCFVVKFLKQTLSDEIETLSNYMFGLIDAQKKEILEREEKTGACKIIRFIVEVLEFDEIPSGYLYVIGKPKRYIQLQKHQHWLVSNTASLACYGIVDLKIELDIYYKGNTSDVPNTKRIYKMFAHSTGTLHDLKSQLMQSGEIDINEYMIGNFYNDFMVFVDESLPFVDCLQMDEDRHDISCMIVWGNEILL